MACGLRLAACGASSPFQIRLKPNSMSAQRPEPVAESQHGPEPKAQSLKPL
jgi:hypothetical protein